MALPFPVGWYAIRFSHELAPGAVERVTFCGQSLVLFRTESGRAALVDAYCPHLGAHFGHGGTVEGEALRCPFHGFCFDTTGACVSTPYQKKLPPLRAHTWPLREHGGAILAWYHPAGHEPTWEVPELPDEGFGELRTHIFADLKSHPQETTENSVDLGHLSVVHGYKDVEMQKPLRTDGPYLTARYAMSRDNPFFPALSFLPPAPPVKAEFEVHVHGLGYSFIAVAVPDQGIEGRHFVYCTPTKAGFVDLRVAICQKVPSPAQVAWPLGWMPRRLAEELVGRLTMRAYVNDIAQDFDIWQNKRYIQPPALADGDGPVGPYRKWCKQFYPSPTTDVGSTDVGGQGLSVPV
jgi:nitrite reductase/ring-hydroxylating ferredoxin subunit